MINQQRRVSHIFHQESQINGLRIIKNSLKDEELSRGRIDITSDNSQIPLEDSQMNASAEDNLGLGQNIVATQSLHMHLLFINHIQRRKMNFTMSDIVVQRKYMGKGSKRKIMMKLTHSTKDNSQAKYLFWGLMDMSMSTCLGRIL